MILGTGLSLILIKRSTLNDLELSRVENNYPWLTIINRWFTTFETGGSPVLIDRLILVHDNEQDNHYDRLMTI